MLLNPPDRRSLQKTFGRVLNDILDGTADSAPEGNGLDAEVNAALNDLAAHLDDQRAAKTLAAYEALGAQISGQHSAAAEADIVNQLGL